MSSEQERAGDESSCRLEPFYPVVQAFRIKHFEKIFSKEKDSSCVLDESWKALLRRSPKNPLDLHPLDMQIRLVMKTARKILIRRTLMNVSCLFCTTVAILTVVTSQGLRADERNGLLSILPKSLEDASGKRVDTNLLEGKIVGLYFSAHWCPPCRAFTPKLVEFRDKYAEQGFEIVFVSLDNSDRERKAYIKGEKMKWLMVSGARSREAEKLSKRFQVSGIPSLIILSPDGKTITENGRSDVSVNPDSALETWKKSISPSQ